MNQSITLIEDQEIALQGLFKALTDDDMPVIVLKGYAGCGKSTLVKVFMNQVEDYMTMAKLCDPTMPEYEIVLSATTNKAKENLQGIVGSKYEVRTIYSVLGLRVQTESYGKSKLVPSSHEYHLNKIFLVDEAGMMDSFTLNYLFKQSKNCKFILIGDPAQIININSATAPAFNAGFPEVCLTKPMRQEGGNPIIDLVEKFRFAVGDNEFFSFKPDGEKIIHMNDQDFIEAVEKEFLRANWHYHESKILAYTNKQVIAYNNYLRGKTSAGVELQEGDYALCNSFIKGTGKNKSISTDATVLVTAKGLLTEFEGIKGHFVSLDYMSGYFLPLDVLDKPKRIKELEKVGNYRAADKIAAQVCDLRASYAITVDKSMGSTYDKVFIDLNDIGRCNNLNRMFRMLYVATSRPRNQIIFTGDLV